MDAEKRQSTQSQNESTPGSANERPQLAGQFPLTGTALDAYLDVTGGWVPEAPARR